MAEKWYEDLPDDTFITKADKAYEETVAKIREGLAQGLDFDSACSDLQVEDEELKKNIIDDMLKVLIAEEHFTKNLSLDKMAKKLKISVERLESEKLSMIEEIRNASIKAFYNSLGSGSS